MKMNIFLICFIIALILVLQPFISAQSSEYLARVNYVNGRVNIISVGYLESDYLILSGNNFDNESFYFGNVTVYDSNQNFLSDYYIINLKDKNNAVLYIGYFSLAKELSSDAWNDSINLTVGGDTVQLNNIYFELSLPYNQEYSKIVINDKNGVELGSKDIGNFCGDGYCKSGENCTNCPIDCGGCFNDCGNAICDPGESCLTCPQDCGNCLDVCGDGYCKSGENCTNCPIDCGGCFNDCGDGKCDFGENCISCPQDCGNCLDVCGDGKCDSGENCLTCLQDCGRCLNVCGDGICDAGETCSTCPADCGQCSGGAGGSGGGAGGSSIKNVTNKTAIVKSNEKKTNINVVENKTSGANLEKPIVTSNGNPIVNILIITAVIVVIVIISVVIFIRNKRRIIGRRKRR